MIKAIDLFSGCGGVSIGLTNAGFKVASAVEIDDQAVAAYKKYAPLSHVNVLKEDICKLSGDAIIAAGGIKRDDIYLLAGCPPCQKFSMQNRKNYLDENKKDEVKKLLMNFKRIIKEVYPPFVLMENVPGIKSSYNGTILREFLTELENKGGKPEERYHIEYAVLNAANYGVPQLRKRFVLHAVRCDVYQTLQDNNFAFGLPQATHSENGENGLLPWVSVTEAFAGLPHIVAGQRYSDDIIKNHYCANLSETNIARMIAIRANGGSRTGLPDNLVLKCHREFGGHTDVYGIMDPDRPSPTMTGGCLSYTKGRFGHPVDNRAISVREAARLQTFPDDYIFGESITKAALEIGNAVPIRLVEASGRCLINLIKTYQKLLKFKL